MRKKSLVLTLMLAFSCLLGGGDLMGQPVTIGSGTTTNNNLPSSSNLKYGFSEQIYTKDEIKTAGGYAGNIISIAFYNDYSSAKTRNYDIYLVHTEKSTFDSETDWISVSESDLYYSGMVELSGSSWTTIDFSKTFIWDDKYNIALVIDDNTNSSSYGFRSYVFNATSQSVYVVDNTNIDPSNLPTTGSYSTWTVGNVKNIIKLEFESASSCSKPTNLGCINFTSNAATLDWTENGTADTWQMVYSTDPDFAPNSATPITVTTKPYTLRGLTAESTYYAYVRSYGDADNQSAWSNKCEFTPSAQVAHTVNNGTDTYANIPFYYNVALSNIKSQFIIPSSDLTSMTGSKINKLTFYTYSTYTNVNYGDATFDVYLAEVESTTLSSYYDWDSKDLTKVYSGNLSVSSNQMIISLSTPYNYQGGNLMIGFNMTSTGTSPSYVSWYGVNSTDGCCRYNSGYAYEYSNKFLPKTTFTYTPAIKFATTGNWNVTDNWYGNIPSSTDNVLIKAAVTIPNGYTATANNITIDGGSLTIADGGQLVCNNSVQATVQKSITGYGKGNDKWYFIASPINVNDLAPTSVSNMLSNEYDLYQLNNTTWENYKEQEGNANPNFNLANGRGYLYANSTDVDLGFAGTTKPYDADYEISVAEGWNLVGNPYTFDAYVNTPYYAMNEGGTGITATTVSTSTAVKPCTGVIIKADAAGTVKFLNEAPASSTNNGNLQIALAHNVVSRDGASTKSATIDNAIVSFNEGTKLEKFYFGEQAANIFIPQNGDEYAIAFSDRKGEVPVNFKAKETGTYTINFDRTDLNSIKLIDKLENLVIDLNENSSYTFIGSPADRAERFVIRFENSEQSDNSVFAYQSGSDIVVTGEGELQIFDVMGRLVSKQNVNGVETINVNAHGVYIFRLNGKVQKIIIK